MAAMETKFITMNSKEVSRPAMAGSTIRAGIVTRLDSPAMHLAVVLESPLHSCRQRSPHSCFLMPFPT